MLSYKVVLLAVLSSSAWAAPLATRPLPRYTLAGREVPQEHSHEDIIRSVRATLQLNNPDEIVDPVFSLLGNAAAAQGLGKIEDPDCLQQAIADQAFTNAKEAGDIDAMTDALIFRALERNSATVGATTAPCTSLEAVNPEVAALQQHQDPASDNAAAVNKEIALNLAVQIASIGGDPQRAIESGTFPPGEIGDPTGAGNTCDDENDANGCINTLGLLVPDVTPDEIDEAVAAAGGAANNADAANNAADNANAAGNADTAACGAAAAAAGAADNAAADATSAATGDIGDFGICTVPEIEFGAGFEGRKETSFRPVDLNNFNHGSAQGFGIIGTFVCDQLVNRCGADQTALDTCDRALAAADAEAPKTGAQADAFNAVFGITSNFADITPIDDQGREVVARSVPEFRRRAARRRVHPTRAVLPPRQNIGDFGSCSVPEISFGVFEGRKETSFIPADLDSFNHGSAQNFDIIGQFVCDQLVNKCGADQTALNTCDNAIADAQAETPKTGAQADAFNAAFGITTNFASVQALDNQGQPVAGTGAAAATGANTATAAADCAQANGAAAADAADNAAADNAAADNAATDNAASGNAAAATGNNFQTFSGNLGGAPPAVTAGGRGFEVEGSDDFLNVGAALGRSCDIQHNACANAANSGAGFSAGDCDQQNNECRALIQ